MALQEKSYSYGSLAWQSVSNAYILDLIVKEESIDQVNNTSLISYTLQLRSGPNNRFTDTISASVTIAGVTKSTSLSIYAAYNKTYTLLTGSQTVTHDADGSLSLSVQGKTWGVSDNKYAPPDMSVSGTLALTQIPRASTLGATDGDIGSMSVIAVDRKSTAYTHSIGYQFGSLTGYIKGDGSVSSTEVKLTATNISFQIPTTFYAQIPNGKSGVCTLTCKTYSGTAQIDQAQTATFTAKVNQSQNTPQVTGTVQDINSKTLDLTGDSSILVRYQSTARCTISAQAKNSASIVSRSVNGQSLTQTLDISAVQTGSFVFRAQDSRGYSASCSISKTVIPYVPLTCNVSIQRPEPTEDRIVLTISKSNYFKGSFGSKENALTISYVSGSQSGTITPVIQDNSYTAELELTGFPYDETRKIQLTVSDKLTTLNRSLTVMRGLPVFDWSQTDFCFHVPVTAPSVNGSAGPAGILPDGTDVDTFTMPGVWRVVGSYTYTGLPDTMTPAILVVLSPFPEGISDTGPACLHIVTNYSASERKIRTIWYDKIYDWNDL